MTDTTATIHRSGDEVTHNGRPAVIVVATGAATYTLAYTDGAEPAAAFDVYGRTFTNHTLKAREAR